MRASRTRLTALLTAALVALPGSAAWAAEQPPAIVLDHDGYRVVIHPDGFRYELQDAAGHTLAPAHAESGLRVRRAGASDFADAVSAKLVGDRRSPVAVLDVGLADGSAVKVQIRSAAPGTAAFSLLPMDGAANSTVDFRTGPVAPAFGLGDTGAQANDAGTGTPCGGKVEPRATAELTGIVRDDMTNEGSCKRFLTNFVIFPGQGLAEVLLTDGQKRVALTATENRLGVGGVDRVDNLYYFVGSPRQIYSSYRTVRGRAGYHDVKPRPDLFEVGWEAYGALGWDTYQSSVMDTLRQFVEHGYRLGWAVIGSGFWPGPRGNPVEGTTNSFGMWDDTAEAGRDDGLPNPRYPDVAGLKTFLADNGIDLLLGSRNNFKALPEDGGNYNPANDGPATLEALRNGYYLTDADGTPLVVSRAQFPSGASYVLDASNPEAVAWYVRQNATWGAAGVKEDTMLYNPKLYRDGNWNALNEALAESGQLVIVRNTAYSVPGDTMRINDTTFGHGEDYNTDPDRIPINLLNFAASGASNVYPDIVGGTPKAAPTDPSYQRYYVRNAMFDALTPSMAFGRGPWTLGYLPYEQAAKKAADWHSALHPYIYDAVLDGYDTGYPSAMTPLPIAYPGDPGTYDLASRDGHRYEWMLGESLLATPVFGRDFDTAQSRDVYLPAGRWIDYETGATFQGPVTLHDYPIGVDRIPAFVGGKGVLVSRSGSGTTARIFPVTSGWSRYEFTAADGRTRSAVVNANTGWDTGKLVLTDTSTGRGVAFSVDARTGALSFPFTPGHDYTLTGGGTAAHPLPRDTAAPEQVSGVAHDVADGVVTLSWNAADGARGYVVQRVDETSCGTSAVASTTGATSVALGPDGGVGGTFQVVAYNEAGRAVPSAPHEITAGGAAAPVIVTNEQTAQPCGGGPAPYTETGRWASGSLKGFDGSGTRYSSTEGSTATWQSTVQPGQYEVAVWYPASTTSTPSAGYRIGHEGGTTDVVVDQRTGAGTWLVLGTWRFTGPAAVTLTVSGAGGYARADAVRFTPR